MSDEPEYYIETKNGLRITKAQYEHLMRGESYPMRVKDREVDKPKKTIKTWFQDHPNITFLILFAITILSFASFMRYLDAERWGYAVWQFFVWIVMSVWSYTWWSEKL